ncbi:glycosyltransferase [Paenibacillus sp. GCM10012307]|uniref:Glycosyltransferase n=1 Tax=Paenibacillus roseus TaxID=2798579 RepID=A0A934J922_9BACL|nr:glycosyltransferase [Paenibacillus roseus]MBJ6363813.1 glycosyltransferase [Paenibacillus roseus]
MVKTTKRATKKTIRKRPGLIHSTILHPYEQGRRYGLATGWDHGYWFGQCEAVIQKTIRPAVKKDIHLLYVATGKGFPYSPIDEAIITTLSAMVTQLSVTDALQDVSLIAKEKRPDLVLVLDGLQLDLVHPDEMRAAGIRTAIWFTDDPYYTDVTSKVALHYDHVFTLEKTCVDFYLQHGCNNVYYLPLGFYPQQFRPRNPSRSRRKEICFVGTAYWKRIEFFNEISDYLHLKDSLISGIWWDRLPNYEQLASKIELNKWMGPDETAETYNGAKIVINMHRAHDDETFNNNSANIPAISLNPRTFEISGCGTLQLSDIRDDIKQFFIPGEEIVTYSSPKELTEKAEYYLKHEEERRGIALRALYRTMRDHTYERRLETLLSTIFG